MTYGELSQTLLTEKHMEHMFALLSKKLISIKLEANKFDKLDVLDKFLEEFAHIIDHAGVHTHKITDLEKEVEKIRNVFSRFLTTIQNIKNLDSKFFTSLKFLLEDAIMELDEYIDSHRGDYNSKVQSRSKYETH